MGSEKLAGHNFALSIFSIKTVLWILSLFGCLPDSITNASQQNICPNYRCKWFEHVCVSLPHYNKKPRIKIWQCVNLLCSFCWTLLCFVFHVFACVLSLRLFNKKDRQKDKSWESSVTMLKSFISHFFAVNSYVRHFVEHFFRCE